MKFNVLTIFPEMFDSFLTTSIVKRAIEQDYVNVKLFNFRDFTKLKHNKVDDYQYGGGDGLVISVQPVVDCLKSIENKGLVVALCPKGEKLSDALVNELSNENEVITFICGHYEGFDERIYNYVDKKISIGDYILTGGELPAMILIDAITRKTDGVIRKSSHELDSFNDNLLDYPAYTTPKVYDEYEVPEVLLSGNHKNIAEYRYNESLETTYQNRPDLFEKHCENNSNKVLKKFLDIKKGNE